jgi:hypothetical protein
MGIGGGGGPGGLRKIEGKVFWDFMGKKEYCKSVRVMGQFVRIIGKKYGSKMCASAINQ